MAAQCLSKGITNREKISPERSVLTQEAPAATEMLDWEAFSGVLSPTVTVNS